MLRVAVVSSTRADYSHLVWPLRALKHSERFDPQLVLFGAHLADEFGNTHGQVTADGFAVAARVESHLSSDTDTGMAKSLGVATLGLADAFDRLRPDVLLLIADRYEMLAAATVATTMRIPIVHIEGGEVSQGAIDDAIRNALTKLSHWHLVPHEEAAARVRNMGESAERIHVVGAPSLDHLRHAALLTDDQLRTRLTIPAGVPIHVIAHHPVTMDDHSSREIHAVLEALRRCDGFRAFCYPNADAGNQQIRRELQRFVGAEELSRLYTNLAPVEYFSLLSHASTCIGNSSSGIMETGSFELPTVNIGRRQQGRLQGPNVLDVPADADAIAKALSRAMSDTFRISLAGMKNPYDKGSGSANIVRAMEQMPSRSELLSKPPVRAA